MTFVAGVAVGIFVYFTGFKSIDQKLVFTPTQSDFEIIVSHYGRCAEITIGCPSYRISSEGQYTFIDGNMNTKPQSGVLEKSSLVTLESVLVQADLEQQSLEAISPACDAAIGLSDVTYQIRLKNKQYFLDTCSTNVDVDSDLIELLDTYMEEFVTVR